MKSIINYSLTILVLIPFVLTAQLKTPDWASNATIYEVNVRQYTTEGTFTAFQKHLPRLKELGVDILWLMPINPIGEKNRKGTLGSYYSIKDYKEINPEFGNKNDFKNLVDEIHKEGMYIIVDWVGNHTAWDHPWVTSNPEYYTKDSMRNFISPVADWADVIDLNFDNKNLREEMIDALCYWVKDFDIDGYRCDVAGMIPTDFWNDVRFELDKIKPVFMLAEWHTTDLHEKAFEMTYGWDIHRMMNNIYKGEKSAADLKNLIIEDQKTLPAYAYRMQFTSNHDENTWNGTEFDRIGDAAEMCAVFTYIIPGMPLIYNGQEAGSDKRLEFFEKDLIPWKESKYSKLYSDLNNLKQENKALLHGQHFGKLHFIETDNKNALAVLRENGEDKVFGIFNFSNSTIELNLTDKNLCDTYVNYTTKGQISISEKLNVTLDPWSYNLYFTKK